MGKTLDMMKHELPRTMGDLNTQLLYEDVCQAIREEEQVLSELTTLRIQNKELLEALEEVRDDFGQFGNGGVSNPTIERVRSAIAKANNS